MGQGIIGGMTSYENQTLHDILEDIQNWEKYSSEIITLFQKTIPELKAVKKFDNYIPYDFQMTLLRTSIVLQTFMYDFDIVKKEIIDNEMTEKGINLLRKIGINSSKLNNEYGTSYHKDNHWKEYGEKYFTIIENLYQQGRNHFVTLQDASNAAHRLADYKSSVEMKTTNILNIEDNSISIGDKVNIKNSTVGNKNKKSDVNVKINEEKPFFLRGWFLSILGGVASAVIAGIILAIIL